MKKQLWPGVALGIALTLNGAVYANSVRDTLETKALQKTEPSNSLTSLADPAKATGPTRDRLVTDSSKDMGARWSLLDQTGNAALLAFTSTFAANNARQLMAGKSNSLSFSNFGRVPFYQVLALTNDVTSNSANKTSANPTASLPEPATLVLLGAGLAALAAGLRKKNKKFRK